MLGSIVALLATQARGDDPVDDPRDDPRGDSRDDSRDPGGPLGDWSRDWRVADGFALEVDAVGFTHPTAIAFVPSAGASAKDPLYFVTELGGRVAVVSNDRSVHTFAQESLALDLSEPLPSPRGEGGMAGIALDGARGLVFVSALVADEAGVLRNRIIRYDSVPGRFSLAPTGRTVIDAPFAGHVAAVSHQIGPMAIDGDAALLYVGVGDGKDPATSRTLASPNGKILRLTLDGAPAPGNPFAPFAPGPGAAVFALGLRNPFSLAFADGELFAADNGPAIDRFVRVTAGRDFLYDGSDWSVGMAAELVLSPAVSPVQMAFLPPEGTATQFPSAYRSRFYVAFAGHPARKAALGEKGIASIPFDVANKRFSSPPEMLVQYMGEAVQTPVGLALGPDALYFAPLFPLSGAAGPGAILRLRHDPQRAHPFTIARTHADGEPGVPALLKAKGCFGCHTRLVAHDAPIGPSLDRARLAASIGARVASTSPLWSSWSSLEASDAGVAGAAGAAGAGVLRAMRAQVRAAPEAERAAVFLAHRIREPRLDDPRALMPALPLTEREARRIADWLLSEQNTIAPDSSFGSDGEEGQARLEHWYQRSVNRIRIKYGLIGAAIAGMLMATYRLARRRPKS